MKAMLLALSLCVFPVRAEQPDEDPARHEIGKEGQIFAVRVVPGDNKLEVRFVDRPLATLQSDRLTINVQSLAANGATEEVPVQAMNGDLRLGEPMLKTRKYDIKIHDKLTKKAEVIRLEPRD